MRLALGGGLNYEMSTSNRAPHFRRGRVVYGERGKWRVSVTAPGNVASECETQEASWFSLFNEMLADACESSLRINGLRLPSGHGDDSQAKNK